MFVTCKSCGQTAWLAPGSAQMPRVCARCHAPLDPSEPNNPVAPDLVVSSDSARRRRKRIAIAAVALLWLLFLLWWLLHGFVPGIGSGQGALSGDLSGGSGGGQAQAQGPSEVNPGQSDPTNAVPPVASTTKDSSDASGVTTSNAPPSDLITLGDDPLKPRRPQNAGPVSPGSAGVSGMFSGGRGSKFVYVLDKSGSMSMPGKFESVIRELKRQLALLTPRHHFFIIFFDDQAHPMRGTGLQQANKQNLSSAFTWLATQNTSGGTDPREAIFNALDLEPDTIWVLSDGEFSTHVVDEVNAANRLKRVCINTIAYYQQAEMTLKRLAEANEGRYRYVPAPSGPPPGLNPGQPPWMPPGTGSRPLPYRPGR